MSIATLKPEAVWERFAAICAIPHPSHHEKALGESIIAWAKEKGLGHKMDNAGNIALYRPASPGKEKSPGIILQAHLDMVPQKAANSDHDFLKDPILPRIDPKDPAWVIATDTTLGADNGIGLAMAMALMVEPELRSGPLECLFTVDEEDGMSGAAAVEPGFVNGSILLNLDGEDADELTIGCAGSLRLQTRLSSPAENCPPGLVWLKLELGGLLGGHSGVDINKGRANANLLLARLLSDSKQALYLSELSGGSASNAIPRDSVAVVGLPQSQLETFKNTINKETAAARVALGIKDPGLTVNMASVIGQPEKVLGKDKTESLLTLLGTIPNGLQSMEPDMPGQIRTSLNMGVLKVYAHEAGFNADITVMIRSSSDSDKENLTALVKKRLESMSTKDWSVDMNDPEGTLAWSPNSASPLLAKAKESYKELFGSYPSVASTHGGLETGLFRPRFPHWDMISFGPSIEYPHSPDERLNIASVDKSYRFLKHLVSRL